MNFIVIFQSRPIYATNDIVVDYCKVAKGLETKSSFVADWELWRRSPNVFIRQMIIGYDLGIWRWNPIQNDWVGELKHNS